MATAAQTCHVTLRFQYPAWDGQDGLHYEVLAIGKSDAVARVRRMAARDRRLGSGKGRASSKARRAV